MNFLRIPLSTGFVCSLLLVFLCIPADAQNPEKNEEAPAPPKVETPKHRTFLRIINAVRPQVDPVWTSGLDLKMGEQILAKEIRSGEGGGYAEIKVPLKGSLQVLRSSNGKMLLSQDSELKKDSFNTVIIYGSLGSEKSSLKMLFHTVEKESMPAPKLRLLNCIDFFDVTVALGSLAPQVYPLAEWQSFEPDGQIRSMLLSYEDDQKRKLQLSQQLIMEAKQEYWILLSPNPHLKAFQRPRVTIINESQAQADALELVTDDPKPSPAPTPVP